MGSKFVSPGSSLGGWSSRRSRSSTPRPVDRAWRTPRRIALAAAIAIVAAAGCRKEAPPAAKTKALTEECRAFQPQQFVRTTGKPNEYQVVFSRSNPGGPFVLRVENGNQQSGSNRCSSAEVSVNGVEILTESNFNQGVAYLEVPVTLLATNTLHVRLASTPGCYLLIDVEDQDVWAPEIAITSPESDAVFNTQPIQVSGTINDTAAAVTVNGIAALVDPGGTYAAVGVPLTPGDNMLTARAIDGCENEGSASIIVVFDPTAPSLAASAGGVCSGTVRVSGTATDAIGAITVTIEGLGDPIPVSVGEGGVFSVQVAVPAGATSLEVVARDRINETRVPLALAPVVCTASDQCHDAGTCDPVTELCSNPAKADGSACTDGNACTQTDACQAGTCQGANPVVCTASDQCHDAGTCNPGTGLCSNPAKPDGTTCSDANACTQTDTCQAGACVGASPVVCSASDQCHDAGTCDSATGLCSNPAKADGTACTDGSACTQSDACQAGACQGANPVVCTPSDQCHVAGTCEPATGTCSNPVRGDGTSCTDNNACTGAEECRAGLCVASTRAGIAYWRFAEGSGESAADSSGTGFDLEVPAASWSTDKPPGLPAEAGGSLVFSGAGELATAGDGPAFDFTTRGFTLKAWIKAATAQAAFDSAIISKVQGAAVDGWALLLGSTGRLAVWINGAGRAVGTTDLRDGQWHLVAGTWDGTTARVYVDHVEQGNGAFVEAPRSAGVELKVGSYSAAAGNGSFTGHVDEVQIYNFGQTAAELGGAFHAGTACDDGNPCTAETCNPTTGCGHVPVADGSSCSDGNACNGAETCQAAACAAGTPPACDDGNLCTADSCVPATGCTHVALADGTACSDSNHCTQTDVCVAGACTGGNPVVCAPSDQCRGAGTCDAATGACPNPTAPDGTACNDGNGCTQTDTCHEGACIGANPVACAPAGECRTAGVCDPATGTCSSPPITDGTPCADDGNPCTSDACQGGACSHAPANAGTVCRPAGGPCDAAEACTGTSTECPADGKLTAVCRASAGTCDAPESCDGAGNDCPADSFLPASTVCRAAEGICDAAETCTGSSAACPVDGFAPPSTVCRATTGVCDAEEHCTGSSPSCPANGFLSASTVCRAAAGVCDAEERCTGTSISCPGDARAPGGTLCRAAAAPCDAAEFCTGLEVSCPADGVSPQGTPCRSPAGPCDLAESCNGNAPTCPADVFKPAGTVCATAGHCNASSSCAGEASCPAAPFPDGTRCDDGNACTTGEACLAGSCGGGTPLVCTAPDACRIASCEPALGCVVSGDPCGTGRCWGDPHCQSFDGLMYDYQGEGEYVLVTDGAGFVIHIRTVATGAAVSMVTAVATMAGTSRVGIYRQRDPVLWIDGVATELANLEVLALPGDAAVERNDNPNYGVYLIHYPGGETLKVLVRDSHLDVVPSLGVVPHDPPVVGMLGDANGFPDDDMRTRDGTPLVSPVDFFQLYRVWGDSWRVTQEESLFDYGAGETTATFSDLSFPAAPVSAQSLPPATADAARATCTAAGITDLDLLDACIVDVGTTADQSFAASTAAAPPPVAVLDADADGIQDSLDNCPTVANLDQLDSNGDGIGNECQCLTVVCHPGDCYEAGTCDPTNGICSRPPKANGLPCDDGNACTTSDACSAGVCTVTPPRAA